VKLNFIKLSFFLAALFILMPFASQGADEIVLNPPLPVCAGSNPSVNLSWNSSLTGGPAYYILRKAQGEESFTQIGSTANLFYTDSSVDSDRAYTYQIKSQKGSTFYYSLEVAASPAYCPPVISPPAASCSSDGPHLSLAWTAIKGDVSGYKVYRDEVEIAPTPDTSYSDGPSLAGTQEYSYSVKGIWQNSHEAVSQTVPAQALACPPVLSLSSECLVQDPGGPKINLSWNNLLGVSGYQIFRKGPSDADYVLAGPVSGTSYSESLVDTLPNYWISGQISYYVKAIWAADEKSSDSKTISIPRCAPFLETESNCDEFSFRFSWTKVLGADHYNIYRDGQYIGQNSGVDATSFVDYLDLNSCPGQVCSRTYRVEAVGSGFTESSASVSQNIDCVTVAPPSPAPVLSDPSAYCSASSSQIDISWTPSDNVTYYGLFRNGVNIVSLLQTSYTDSSVENGYDYDYYIVAYGRNGTSAVSANDKIITAVDCRIPSTPILSLTTGCNLGKPYNELSWSSTTNTLSYEVYRGTSASSLSLISTFNSNSPEFSTRNWKDSNVPASANYYYKVLAKGPTGVISSSSDVKSILAGTCMPTTPVSTLAKACESGVSTINLSWTTDGVNTVRYEIFRSDYSSTVPIAVIYDPSIIKTWKDSTVSPQTAYSYKVDAVGYLSSQRSSQGYKAITSYNCASPGSFSLFDPATYCQGPYPQADLYWSTSANADSYDLLRNSIPVATNIISPYADFGMGNALNFDGYYDYALIPNSASLNPGNITLEAWIYPIAYNSYGTIINKRSPDQYILRLNSTNGRVEGYLYINGGWRACTTPTTVTVSLDNWSHVALTYDGSMGKVYVNGIQGCAFSYSGSIASGTSPVRIGTNSTSATASEHFKGKIDNAMIYNRALSAAEISQHYQKNYDDISGLAGFWRFDEGAGQTVSDSSNSGNNGTLGSNSNAESYDPSWVSNGLQSNLSYTWQIRAAGAGGSLFSNETSQTAMPLCAPAKPGLSLSSFCGASGTSIALKWSYSLNATRYEFYNQSGDLIKTVNQGDAEFSSRQWTDDNNGIGFNQQTSYSYSIKAIGSGALNSQSDAVSITTPSCSAPLPPANFTGTPSCSGSAMRISLSWTASANATSYTIYRSPSASPFPVSTSQTSYIDTAVSTNATYTYYAIAYGPGGSSAPTDLLPIATGYCSVSAPTAFVSTACVNSLPLNTVSWIDPFPANTTSYKIYRNATGIGPAEEDLRATITSGMSEFSLKKWTDSSVSPLSGYYYWVKSEGPAGGAISSPKFLTTFSCGLAPIAPYLTLSNSFCVNNLPYAALSWNSVPNAYSYDLYRNNYDASISKYSSCQPIFTDRGQFALSFNGSNYVDIGNPAILNLTDQITVSAWVKIGADNNAYNNIVGKGTGFNSGDSYGLSWNTSVDRIYFFIRNPSNSSYIYGYKSVPYNTSVWHHVVGVFDGIYANVYIDGQIGSKSGATTGIYSGTKPVLIGSGSTAKTYSFNGIIDEVRIYGRALTAAEVQDNYNGVFKNEAGLKGVWHLDEGSGTTAKDESGNNNNGVLTSGPVWQALPSIIPLENNKNYKYTVKAVGAGLESPLSNEVDFNFSCLPLAPQITFSAQCNGTSPQISLSWEADSNTLYWSIYKRRVGEPAFFHLINVSSPAYTDENLESGIDYEYYAEAVGSGGNTISNIYTKKSLFCYSYPYGGEEFLISVAPACYGYSSRIQINWPSDATENTIYYEIWRKNITKSEPDFSLVYSNISASAVKYLDFSNIIEGDEYVYKVKAIGNGSHTFSSQSNEASASQCVNNPPSPPQLYLDDIDYSSDGRFVWLHWTDAGNEEYYEIWRAASPFVKIDERPGNEIPADVAYVDGSWYRILDDNKNYSYKVVAVNDNGRAESNIIFANVPIARPGSFTLTSEKQGLLNKLIWTEPSTTAAGGPINFEIYSDDSEAFSSPQNICTVVCLQTPCEEQLNCIDYTFGISAVFYKAVASNRGGSSESNIISAILSMPVWKEVSPSW